MHQLPYSCIVEIRLVELVCIFCFIVCSRLLFAFFFKNDFSLALGCNF